jgi:hypothetical protein
MRQHYQLLGITRHLKNSELFTESKVRAGTMRGVNAPRHPQKEQKAVS